MSDDNCDQWNLPAFTMTAARQQQEYERMRYESAMRSAMPPATVLGANAAGGLLGGFGGYSTAAVANAAMRGVNKAYGPTAQLPTADNIGMTWTQYQHLSSASLIAEVVRIAKEDGLPREARHALAELAARLERAEGVNAGAAEAAPSRLDDSEEYQISMGQAYMNAKADPSLAHMKLGYPQLSAGALGGPATAAATAAAQNANISMYAEHLAKVRAFFGKSP